jgi:hypothetical protein
MTLLYEASPFAVQDGRVTGPAKTLPLAVSIASIVARLASRVAPGPVAPVAPVKPLAPVGPVLAFPKVDRVETRLVPAGP